MKIDPKGRASIPKEVREALAEEFDTSEMVVVRTSTNKLSGLWLFPPQIHEKFQEKLKNTSSKNRSAYQRIYEYNEKVGFDSLGRLPLPRRFRSWAMLDGNGPSGKDIVVIHKNDRLEIWDLQTYDQVLAADRDVTAEDQHILDSFEEL